MASILSFFSSDDRIGAVIWSKIAVSIPDYVTAIAAVMGVVLAGFGLSTWKEQLRGTSEYELAKKSLLSLVHDLNVALEMFIRQKRDKAFRSDLRDYEDTIYDKGDDKYNKSLNNAVRAYKMLLKPHLKK